MCNGNLDILLVMNAPKLLFYWKKVRVAAEQPKGFVYPINLFPVCYNGTWRLLTILGIRSGQKWCCNSCSKSLLSPAKFLQSIEQKRIGNKFCLQMIFLFCLDMILWSQLWHFFRINAMACPALSPDLNTIEHIWYTLERISQRMQDVFYSIFTTIWTKVKFEP